jgi:hypothetical protein
VLRLDEPRLLSARALEPPLAPPNALPEEEERLPEGLDFDCEGLALGDELRLADGVPVDGRALALAVEGAERLAVLGLLPEL